MEAPQHSNSPFWPLVHIGSRRGARREKGIGARRPDVSAQFTVVLVSALASGWLLIGELLGMRVPLTHWLSFALSHPIGYVFGLCFALLFGLLAVGDV